MECGIIAKANISKLIDAVKKKAVFYAPVNGKTGVEFKEVDGKQEIAFDYSNSKIPPKKFLFPQCELLLRFKDNNLTDTPLNTEKAIIFGLRPCDTKSFLYLDKAFGDTYGKYDDPYYRARRGNVLFVSMACNNPCKTCFCTTVGSHPADTAGSDIIAYDLGSELLLEATTPGGDEFLKTNSGLFDKIKDSHRKEKDKKINAALEKMKKFDIDGLKQKIDAVFLDEVWQEIVDGCLGCGICTYLCPTCYCFDVTDEKKSSGEGVRVRTWDSCQYSLFTYHTSGHNPRNNKTKRMRQRIMHKFSYTVDNFEDTYCVGCGRCIRGCPVNLDIREKLQKLNKVNVE
ncbi:MAG: 4Fe-4S dicluster domain-containing protein [Spirochaetales bacterium]|nr:4Fe-4S dicluster domain-containing protein [Spirochaetales bacterium]